VSNVKEPVIYRYFENAMSAVSGIESTMPNSHSIIFFDAEKHCNEEIHESNNTNCSCWWKKLQPQGRTLITPVSLSEIIKRTNITEVDFLSLDVEGHEYEVLKSWDFSIPIYVILIEMLGSDKIREDLCRQILIDNKYTFYANCAHNEVYVLTKE
jgi:FkbM family methyltransferase